MMTYAFTCFYVKNELVVYDEVVTLSDAAEFSAQKHERLQDLIFSFVNSSIHPSTLYLGLSVHFCPESLLVAPKYVFCLSLWVL